MAAPRVWLFDLDDTLHDAQTASMPHLHVSFGEYIQRHLRLSKDESDALRRRYWQRYGATLLGLVRHHGVRAQHFLHHTHVLPGLEDRVRGHARDFAALARLPGRKFILTNAPADYTRRVMGVLGIERLFDGVIPIERMAMFGHLRPKPDARMLRRVAVRLRVHPARCVLVEDTVGHLKSARRVRMGTVWMQRFTRGATWGIAAATRVTATPPYVDRRITGLRGLERQCLPAPGPAPAL